MKWIGWVAGAAVGVVLVIVLALAVTRPARVAGPVAAGSAFQKAKAEIVEIPKDGHAPFLIAAGSTPGEAQWAVWSFYSEPADPADPSAVRWRMREVTGQAGDRAPPNDIVSADCPAVRDILDEVRQLPMPSIAVPGLAEGARYLNGATPLFELWARGLHMGPADGKGWTTPGELHLVGGEDDLEDWFTRAQGSLKDCRRAPV